MGNALTYLSEQDPVITDDQSDVSSYSSNTEEYLTQNNDKLEEYLQSQSKDHITLEYTGMLKNKPVQINKKRPSRW